MIGIAGLRQNPPPQNHLQLAHEVIRISLTITTAQVLAVIITMKKSTQVTTAVNLRVREVSFQDGALQVEEEGQAGEVAAVAAVVVAEKGVPIVMEVEVNNHFCMCKKKCLLGTY